jgi:hypothetical protein
LPPLANGLVTNALRGEIVTFSTSTIGYLEVIRFLAKHGDTAKLKQCADVFLSKAEILSLSSVK